MKKAWLVLLLAMGLSGGELQAQVATPKTGFDIELLYKIKKTRTPFQTALFRTMSDLNNPVCLAVPAALFLIGWIRKRKSLKWDALQVTETIAISQSITFLMKVAIGRVRPQYFDTNFIPLVTAINKSFPSGHTSEAFAMAASVALFHPKWYYTVPAFAWAFLIGYARMYLGVHFLTDVLGGIIVGVACAWLTYRINKWTESRRARRKEAAASKTA